MFFSPYNITIMKAKIDFRMLLVALLIWSTACNTPTRLYKNGEYDEAINAAVKKVRSKHPKDKDIVALEKAFNYINLKEDIRMTQLIKENNDDNWEEIYSLAERINTRQILVKPLLPIRIKGDNRDIKLKYFEIEKTLLQSKENAAATLYNAAVSNLELANKGDRGAARKAYADLNKISRFYKNYKDRDQLLKQAKALGLNHVYFKMENNSNTILPAGFERAMLSVPVRDLNSDWVEYATAKTNGIDFDYHIIANVTKADVGPESVNNREHTEEAEIQDGFQYVLDSKGNVMKDSAGNDMKVPKYVKVSAHVYETIQEKHALVSGFIDFYDNRSKEKVYSAPIRSEAVFQNYAARYDGDKRALKKETLQHIGNAPKSFPSDPDLLLQAADGLKENARKEIWDHKDMVQH